MERCWLHIHSIVHGNQGRSFHCMIIAIIISMYCPTAGQNPLPYVAIFLCLFPVFSKPLSLFSQPTHLSIFISPSCPRSSSLSAWCHIMVDNLAFCCKSVPPFILSSCVVFSTSLFRSFCSHYHIILLLSGPLIKRNKNDEKYFLTNFCSLLCLCMYV